MHQGDRPKNVVDQCDRVNTPSHPASRCAVGRHTLQLLAHRRHHNNCLLPASTPKLINFLIEFPIMNLLVVVVVIKIRARRPSPRRVFSNGLRRIALSPRSYRTLTFWTRLHFAARALQQISPNVLALWAYSTTLYFFPPVVVAAG